MLVILELVLVPAVETTRFVEGIVKFAGLNTGVTLQIQVTNEISYAIQKGVFVGILVLVVNPINPVVSYCPVLFQRIVIADSGQRHPVVFVERKQITLELLSQFFSNKPRRDAHLIVYQTPNQAFKVLIQGERELSRG
jgi:hypothetical protein